VVTLDTTTASTQVWDAWTTGTTALHLWPTPRSWIDWNRTYVTHNQPWTYVAPQPPEVPPIPERDKAILKRRRDVAAMRVRNAKRRARALLEEHLDERQLEQWRNGEEFTVECGRRTYRIRLGLAGNVYLVENNGAKPPQGRSYLRRYCCHVYHPDGDVPNEDNVLAQKLLLEADEDAFLAMANLA
jgi:hypothetical protein